MSYWPIRASGGGHDGLGEIYISMWEGWLAGREHVQKKGL